MVQKENEKPPVKGGGKKSYSKQGQINYRTILFLLSSGRLEYEKLDQFSTCYHSKKVNFYIKKRKNYDVDAVLYNGKTELFLIGQLEKEVFYISSLWKVFVSEKMQIYKLEYRGITFDLVINNEKKEVFLKRTGEKNAGYFSGGQNANSTL